MGTNLEADVAGLRLLASRLGELIVAASCSKNLGLYRERTGVALFLGKTRKPPRQPTVTAWAQRDAFIPCRPRMAHCSQVVC